jgi:hypothetical protein
MRLGYALELILAVAAGLTVARIRSQGEDLRDRRVWFNHVVLLSSSFLTGFVVVEAVCLCVEVARHRSPSTWGVGRHIWALLGITSLVLWLWYAANDWAFYFRGRSDAVTLDKLIGVAVFHSHLPVFYDLAWLPLAIWLTSRLARWPRPLTADGREWVGRAFGVMLVVSRCVVEIIHLTDFGFWLH